MPGPSDETERCEACGRQIAASRYPLHVRGLDGGHPECPKQDIVEIALRARGEWDALRARYQEVPARW